MPLLLQSTSAYSDHTFGDLEMASPQSSEESGEESPRHPEAPGAVLPMVGAASQPPALQLSTKGAGVQVSGNQYSRLPALPWGPQEEGFAGARGLAPCAVRRMQCPEVARAGVLWAPLLTPSSGPRASESSPSAA